MASVRWIVPWADSPEKPAIYHCIGRVVDRRFAFEAGDKEQFRMYLRMVEGFSGCRVLAYCVMCNHFHVLLEVPPMPKEGLSDEELLKRLRCLYPEATVALLAKELAEARQAVAEGRAVNPGEVIRRIHQRYTYRMHDLSEFMKTLLQRFTRWHNKRTNRRGNLWEETFKSVIVEDGWAARAMAAYIDLNPVRSRMVQDPAEYRWSSYGEAMGATGRSGAKAKAGLVRAFMAHEYWEADARRWAGRVSREYRSMLLEEGAGRTRETVNPQGERVEQVVRKGMRTGDGKVAASIKPAANIPFAAVLRWKIRYFTDGAAIGSRMFLEDLFARCRDRFGSRRKTAARKLRGSAAGVTGLLWSVRDLRKGTG